MFFAIAAPQSVVLPNGLTLDFRVNPADTSLVEIHLRGLSLDGQQGTYIIPFKRNGSSMGVPEFFPAEQPAPAPHPQPVNPDDRMQDAIASPDGEYPRAAENKVVTTETLQPDTKPS